MIFLPYLKIIIYVIIIEKVRKVLPVNQHLGIIVVPANNCDLISYIANLTSSKINSLDDQTPLTTTSLANNRGHCLIGVISNR